VPLHEVVPVIADDGFDVRDVDLQKVELEHEALAQVARADADGVERRTAWMARSTSSRSCDPAAMTSSAVARR